ncbi:hypothetical protein FCJ57_16070 [Burkholderia diffusa]|nr:hypothetical protein [Burkholderia diffusa]
MEFTKSPERSASMRKCNCGAAVADRVRESDMCLKNSALRRRAWRLAKIVLQIGDMQHRTDVYCH